MIKVNGYVISEKEFDMACAEKKYMLRKEQLEKEDIEQTVTVLADAVLMLNEAEKENIPSDADEIEATVAKMKSNFKNEDEFSSALSKMGENEDMVRQRIEKNIRLRNFIKQKFFDGTRVSDEDVAKYYENYPERFGKSEEVRASHILFDPADKDKALEVHELLLNGEDFEKHAKDHSRCPSGANGGDLGFFDRGKMVPEFEEAAFTTPVGALSDLVETQFGYHIIRVTDKQEGGKYDFDEVKESLRQSLVNSIVNHKIAKYAESLRETADIVIDTDILKKKISVN